MPRRPLGPIEVPVLALGTSHWGSRLTPLRAHRIADAALNAGITFFDTAEGYPAPMSCRTHGGAERILGHWLKDKPRDRLQICSKVYGPSRHLRGGGPSRLAPDEISTALAGSLDRLGTDYLDLYLLHWPDGEDYDGFLPGRAADRLTAQVGAMGDAVAAGHVRAWGLSNANRGTFEAYRAAAQREGTPPPCVVQNRYSRRADPQNMNAHPVPLMAYGCLDHGDVSPAAAPAALRYALSRSFTRCCCVGSSSPRQLEFLLGGALG